MKIKLQTMLKHNWRTLLLLCTLITISMGLRGNDFYIVGDLAGGDWTGGNKMDNPTTNTYRKWYVISGNSDKYFRIKETWNDGSCQWGNKGSFDCSCQDWVFYVSNDDACKFWCGNGGEFVFQFWSDNHKVNVWQQLYTLTGTFNNWSETDNVFGNGTTCTTSVDLSSNQTCYFKIRAVDGAYYSLNDNPMSRSSNSKTLYTNNNNSTIVSDVAGNYTFSWDISNKQVTVTYPTPKIKGSWDGWTDHNMTVSSATSITWTNTFSSAGKYEFVIMPTTGTGDYKNKNFTRSSNSQTLQQNTGSNATVVIDHPGSYTFTWNSTTGALTITYPTPSTPSALYIKGPLVNNGTWTDDYRQNWSSMTYNKTNNVYTFSFNASNACNNNCSNQSLHFCVSTGTEDKGKIHWAMNSTRTNWDFVNNEGSNFVASSSLVTGTSVPVVLTITYNTSTYQYDMVLNAACTPPAQQDVYIGSSGTTSGSFSICSSGSSTSIWLNASEEGYSYQLKKQNGASWDDVGVAWSNVSSGTDGHEFSGITAAANYKIVGYPTTDGSSISCARDMLNQVTLSHYDNMALSDVSIDASSVCKSGTTTIRTSGANIGGTGVVNYVSSNSSIVAVSSTSTASATLTGGSTAGEATITVSVSGGCGSAPAFKTATLTVNPDTDLSGATISFTPSATCNGNGTVVSISDAQLGGGTGAWSWESGTGKGSINATTGLISGVTTATTGTHTFRYTVTGGCGSNDKTKDENVTLGYSPILSPVQKTVKAYEPVSITSTNANITEWSLSTESSTNYLYDTGKRSAKFKGAPGTYTIKAAASATGLNCPGSATITVEADNDCTPVP